MSDEVKPGLYRHYKGGLYRVLFVARHHETQEDYVVYIPLQGLNKTSQPSPPQLRPLSKGDDCWQKHISYMEADSTGVVTYRFIYVGP